MRAAALLALLAVPSLSGCAALDDLFGSAPPLRITDLQEGEDAWNQENRFQVQTPTDANLSIRIVATDLANGVQTIGEGRGDVTVELDDGTWKIRYYVDGKRRGTLSPVRIDATAPAIEGLERVGDAEEGRYTIGRGATVGADAVSVSVTDLTTDAVVARELPAEVQVPGSGLRAFRVEAVDAAGNVAGHTVQVRSGSAVGLPAGAYSYGVVARYTNELRLWDLTRAGEYLSRPAAQAAVVDETGSTYLGTGFGIEPGDPQVEAIVADTVAGGDNTLEAARALFEWMADELEYDESRLDDDDLLEPEETLERGGGVCRDLAGLYVSLLRSAGVPARLVSGYVGGAVDGFHAWVEFYGGRVGSQSPWVPVDVSPIDGPYQNSLLMQAFGIRLPDYLPLRAIAEDDEVAGWSTAIGVHYQWPEGSPEPEIGLEERVLPGADQRGVLCLEPATGARRAEEDQADCAQAGFSVYLPDFLVWTERTIDYGVEVERAPEGSRIEADVAYPDESGVAPDLVEYAFYGDHALENLEGGKAHFEDRI